MTFRWIMWSLAGVAVAAVAFTGFRLVGQAARGSQEPDLEAFASSRTVRADDKAAAAWLDSQADQLAGQATWLTLAGHALADECSGSDGISGVLGGGLRPSVSCQRTDTWYFAAGHHQHAEIAYLEKILSKSDGWGRFASVPTGSAAQPALPETTAAWTGPRDGRPPTGKVALNLIWVARKEQLAAASLGGTAAQGSADKVRYLQVLKPDLDAVMKRSFGAHKHIVVIAFADAYFTGSSLTPPDPATTGSAPRGHGTGVPGRLTVMRRRDGRHALVT